VGIVLTNTVTEPSGMLMALILFAINLWAIADNWKKYTPMFQQKPVYAENV
jgi:putative oxidoreductase